MRKLRGRAGEGGRRLPTDAEVYFGKILGLISLQALLQAEESTARARARARQPASR